MGLIGRRPNTFSNIYHPSPNGIRQWASFFNIKFNSKFIRHSQFALGKGVDYNNFNIDMPGINRLNGCTFPLSFVLNPSPWVQVGLNIVFSNETDHPFNQKLHIVINYILNNIVPQNTGYIYVYIVTFQLFRGTINK